MRGLWMRWISAAVAALAAGLCGCATIEDPDRESDIPWNQQQSWEGTIFMPPGMSENR